MNPHEDIIAYLYYKAEENELEWVAPYTWIDEQGVSSTDFSRDNRALNFRTDHLSGNCVCALIQGSPAECVLVYEWQADNFESVNKKKLLNTYRWLLGEINHYEVYEQEDLMIKCKLITRCNEVTMILQAELPQAFVGMEVRKGWFQSTVKHVGYDLGDKVSRVYLETAREYDYDNIWLLGFREVDEFGEVTE